jgi:hypothetical protein
VGWLGLCMGKNIFAPFFCRLKNEEKIKSALKKIHQGILLVKSALKKNHQGILLIKNFWKKIHQGILLVKFCGK